MCVGVDSRAWAVSLAGGGNVKPSQSYLDAAALFAAEGWHVQVDDKDGGQKSVAALPPDRRVTSG